MGSRRRYRAVRAALCFARATEGRRSTLSAPRSRSLHTPPPACCCSLSRFPRHWQSGFFSDAFDLTSDLPLSCNFPLTSFPPLPRSVEIIANDQGNRTTPSYVAFTDSERLIGDAAKNQVRPPPLNGFDPPRLDSREKPVSKTCHECLFVSFLLRRRRCVDKEGTSPRPPCLRSFILWCMNVFTPLVADEISTPHTKRPLTRRSLQPLLFPSVHRLR